MVKMLVVFFLQNGEWCSPSSLDAIISLARLSLQCNSEEKAEYKLNSLLLDACLALKDLEQSDF